MRTNFEASQIDFRKHYLYPSMLFVSRDPTLVSTVLGSCVAVCLYDTKKNFGGINHFMLPLWNGQGLATARFGNIAMEKLIDRMVAAGSQTKHMVAKVYGGASLLNFSADIGNRNMLIAGKVLKDHKINVAAQCVGGSKGRKITFNTQTGSLDVQYLSNALKQYLNNGLK